MNFNPELVAAICEQVVMDSPTALRAQRITERQAHLAESMILSPEEAEMHDLNEVIWLVLEDALPLCRSLGARIVLRQDPCLPPVPMLRRPMEDTIASALDMCLSNDAHIVYVETKVLRNRAIATIERRCRLEKYNDQLALTHEQFSSDDEQDDIWRDSDISSTAELLIGARTTRALGGRMRLQHRERDMRLMIELPIRDREYDGWCDSEFDITPTPTLKNRREFPGVKHIPQTF